MQNEEDEMSVISKIQVVGSLLLSGSVLLMLAGEPWIVGKGS